MNRDGGKSAVALAGPTASGKTGIGLHLASSLGTEVISVDSRQIYRRLDIGTAKPTAAELQRVPHHLVDFVDPSEKFSVGDYRRAVGEILPHFEEAGMIPLFVGGTGLYLKAVLEGLCPAPPASGELRLWLQRASHFPAGGLHELLNRVDARAARKIHPNDTYRLTRALEVYYLTGETLSSRQGRHRFAERPFTALVCAVRRSREDLRDRIDRRIEMMIASGFADEVRRLLEAGLGPSLPAFRAVGYPQMVRHIRGKATLPETVDEIRRATWQYARRQMTWFRGVKDIVWIDAQPGSNEEDLAGEILSRLDTRLKGTLK
jgi:tRNA dimethylallyltransferase